MKYLFVLFIAALSVNNNTFAQPTDSLFMKAAIVKLKNAKKYTLQMAALMPDEKYGFKAAPEEMSFGGQLLHIATNIGWLSSAYLANSKNPVTKADGALTQKKDILEVLNKTYDFAIDVLTHFDPSHLSDPVKFFAGPMNKLQIINLLSDHQTHHQGQIIVYLRLNGIKPPDYVGW